MKTPTHAVVGYVTAKAFGLDRAQTFACILGACLPDLPLSLAYGYFVLNSFLQVGHYDAALIQGLMDNIYFGNSWLLIAHNLFHSPISIAYLALMAVICFSRDKAKCLLVLAYLLGSFSHSILDIISHINDGPLVLWPLSDNMRVVGLFSHWLMGMPFVVEVASVIGLYFLMRKQIG